MDEWTSVRVRKATLQRLSAIATRMRPVSDERKKGQRIAKISLDDALDRLCSQHEKHSARRALRKPRIPRDSGG